jgi:hypothetical protein
MKLDRERMRQGREDAADASWLWLVVALPAASVALSWLALSPGW